MKKIFNIIAAYLLLLLPLTVSAQIPRTLSYQGVLTENSGQPKPDRDYAFKFCLFASGVGGSSIWCEEKTLPVKNGLFSTILGDKTPFGPAVKFDRPYWLGIKVGSEDELVPRIPLTSVGYSMSSLRADTARVSVASLADTTWRHSGPNIYRLDGNVGIGTVNPLDKLDVGGGIVGQNLIISGITHPAIRMINAAGNGDYRWEVGPDGSIQLYKQQAQASRIFISPGGAVGIGTSKPETSLQINAGNNQFGSGGEIGFSSVAGAGPMATIKGALVFSGNEQDRGDLVFSTRPFVREPADLVERLRITNNGYVGIGTSTPAYPLDVNGRTRTKVLEIFGGADLAEPFEMSHAEPLPAGALVVIDKDNPGKLKLATEPYDKRVAGVISGAGGVNPGLTLSQEGVLAGGQHVALTGKVYALATAANGAIEPGDLLTTSNVPGHAMRATDQTRWPGAVIGKAMSSLEKGEGLVLVLVNLQ